MVKHQLSKSLLMPQLVILLVHQDSLLLRLQYLSESMELVLMNQDHAEK